MPHRLSIGSNNSPGPHDPPPSPASFSASTFSTPVFWTPASARRLGDMREIAATGRRHAQGLTPIVTSMPALQLVHSHSADIEETSPDPAERARRSRAPTPEDPHDSTRRAFALTLQKLPASAATIILSTARSTVSHASQAQSRLHPATQNSQRLALQRLMDCIDELDALKSGGPLGAHPVCSDDANRAIDNAKLVGSEYGQENRVNDMPVTPDILDAAIRKTTFDATQLLRNNTALAKDIAP